MAGKVCVWRRRQPKLVVGDLELRVVGRADARGAVQQRFANTALERDQLADLYIVEPRSLDLDLTVFLRMRFPVRRCRNADRPAAIEEHGSATRHLVAPHALAKIVAGTGAVASGWGEEAYASDGV